MLKFQMALFILLKNFFTHVLLSRNSTSEGAKLCIWQIFQMDMVQSNDDLLIKTCPFNLFSALLLQPKFYVAKY